MASSIVAFHSPLPCRFCRRSLPTTTSPSRSPHLALLFPPPAPGRAAFASIRSRKRKPFSERRRMGARAVAEEEAVASEGGGEAEPAQEAAPQADQPVTVPVSPSDVLTMFFKAEGTMDESAVSNVTKGLEGLEGVSDLKVQILEGIGSVELTKQTTVQATGVASNLVEIIQGSGFKLQTLNLSFEDEEDAIN